MNIKRINRVKKRDRNFTQIDNDTLRDCSLSYRALGILCESLSHKDEWEVTRDWLAKRRIEGRGAIATAMQELEKAGNITFVCGRNEEGRIVSVGWCFHEIAVCEDDKTNRTRWRPKPKEDQPTVRETRPDGKPTGRKTLPDGKSASIHQKTISSEDYENKRGDAPFIEEIESIETLSPTPKHGAAPLPQLPEELEHIADQWERWQEHRREINKPLTAQAAREHIVLLESMTDTEIRDAFAYSINGGYPALYPPKRQKEQSKSDEPAKCRL